MAWIFCLDSIVGVDQLLDLQVHFAVAACVCVQKQHTISLLFAKVFEEEIR